MEYLCKFEVALANGGSEEGGWWYEVGTPVWPIAIPVPSWLFSRRVKEIGYKIYRHLNDREHERAKREEEYDYHSVLSYRSTHYSYTDAGSLFPKPYPSERPHYE
jgi:hypothetical protein